MKNVDVEAKVLLDKLYNLRGKDSIILTKMDDERVLAEDTQKRTADEKLVIAAKVKELSDEEVLLAKDGELLKDALKNINKESFGKVFSKLSIDFDPQSLSKRVEDTLPSTIAQVKSDIEESNNKLDSIVKEMDDAVTKIDELAIRKDEALSDQSKLNEYIDLAIAGNINITRDALTTLLSKFDLSTSEQRECAKLLMFPEDGLYEYEERFNKKGGKTFSDVFAEAKNGNVEEEDLSITVKLETEDISPKIDLEEEIKPISFQPIKFEIPVKEEKNLEPKKTEPVTVAEKTVEPIKFDSPIKIKEVKEQEVAPIVFGDFLTVKPVNNKEVNVSELLSENGFNVGDFSASDVKFIEEHYNEVVFAKNIKIVSELGLNKDIFNDNVELFVDCELEDKLKELMNIGKVPFDIYLNPAVLVKYDAEELKKSINSLVESGLDPKKVPLMAF